MAEIKFAAIPQSPRANKISDMSGDGGGFRVTLDLDESQFMAWTQLTALRGKLLNFVATIVPENL